jgi:TRAP-type mannitol/chloroaromatic compound transport system permease small subunit
LHALEGFVRAVDRLNRVVGIVGAVAIPAAVLLCAAVALLRYGFAFGRVWMQELYVVLAGVSFMILLARVHGEDGHVRVDILWRRWSERRRALVDLAGNLLFVLPWTLVLIWSSWGFVRLSWSVLEPSAQAGGLPGLFLVKSVIPLAALLLLLQALAGAARALLRLAGRPDPLGPAGTTS